MSAFIAGGPPRAVLQAARRGLIDLIIAELVAEELTRVLVKKLEADPQVVRRYAAALGLLGEVRPVPDDPPVITGHRPDDAILACAVASEARILVTGDRRHLLPVGEHRDVRILTPQALLAELATPT